MAEKKLIVEVANYNVKKLDLKAYGVTKTRAITVVRVGDKEERTTVGLGLDAEWEETFEFPVEDENTKCSVKFLMGEEGQEKQIGDECDYLLSVLIKDKATYKGLIVPGGKVDMTFTAKGFGKEEEPQDENAFLDLMEGEGGMMMDDDEEDEE